MDRRSLLTGLGRRGAEARGKSARIAPLGVQLYTVRDHMAQNVEGTLKAVADIGYEEVEFAGLFDHSASDVRRMLDTLGLTAPASHIAYEVVTEDPDAVFGEAVELGQKYVVVPSLNANIRQSLDDYRRIADTFNEVGVRARAAGLRFGYHNHAFEFEEIDRRRPLDVLLESTDPTLVWFELDLFWAARGGAEPVELFERHPGRFPMIHVKDMDANGDMVDVGRGELDFSMVYANARLAGLEHSFVEHDEPTNSILSIRSSFRYLRGLQVRDSGIDTPPGDEHA